MVVILFFVFKGCNELIDGLVAETKDFVLVTENIEIH